MNNSIKNLKRILEDDLIMRTPAVKYNHKNFLDLSRLFHSFCDEDETAQALEILENYLLKNPLSCGALYLTILLKTHAGVNITSHFDKFINIFTQNKKNMINVYLCQEILEIKESLVALNYLVNYYKKENKKEELLEIYERILKMDSKDYTLSFEIANLKEKLSLIPDAVHYYKMAFFYSSEFQNLFIASQSWNALLKINPNDIKFFTDNLKKMISLDDPKNEEKICLKLFDNIKNNHLEESLQIIKKLIEKNEKNPEYQEKIISLYQLKYQSHSNLQTVFDFTGITKSKKDFNKQIKLFEQIIDFDEGVFVQHKSFGIGVIKKMIYPIVKKAENIATTKLQIDFQKKKSHQMTLRIAITSLSFCHADNLLALHVFDKKKLDTLINGETEILCSAILNTFSKPVSATEIKQKLSPIFELNWNKHWKSIKEIFVSSRKFEIKDKLYWFSHGNSNYDEDLVHQYQTTENIETKFKIADLFLVNFTAKNPLFQKILQDLIKQVKQKFALIPYLFLKNLAKQYNFNLPEDIISKNILDLIDKETLDEEFDNAPFNYLRHNMIEEILKIDNSNDKKKEIVEIIFFSFSEVNKDFLIESLIKKGNLEMVTEIYKKSIDLGKDYHLHFAIICRAILNLREKNFPENLELFYLNLCLALESSYKESSFNNASSRSKKAFQMINHILFDSQDLFDLLKTNTGNKSSQQILSLLDGFTFLENYLKVEIKELLAKV